MQNNIVDKSAQKSKTPLKFIIEDVEFETFDQYKTGSELKELRGIPLHVDLYLKIQKPYEDELIENNKSVNLARPEIERFFVKEVYVFTLNGNRYKSFEKIITGRGIFSIAGITDVNCFSLYKKLKNHDFEKVSLDEKEDLSNEGVENYITKDSETFTYTVNGEHEMTDKKFLTANEILKLDSIDPSDSYLIQIIENGENKNFAYSPEEPIEMSCKGLIFITEKWLDIADVEVFGKDCKAIPPSKKFRIKIDKAYHIVDENFINPSKLIELEGKPSITYNVLKFMNGNPKPILISPDSIIDLTEKCLLRFVLQPKEQKDGRGNRQNFNLPEEDVETLENLGLLWETLVHPGMWLIIYDYPIPEGYNVEKATVALMLSPSYPAGEIDMAHFSPPLSKSNGKSISCTSNHTIDGKIFQQWSRHRNPGEWTLGVDCIATHLSLVDNWLNNDLKR